MLTAAYFFKCPVILAPAAMRCMAKQYGPYVVTNDRRLDPVVGLEAGGFPADGFAKQVEYKVTAPGRFHRALLPAPSYGAQHERRHDTCAPQNQQN